MIPVTKEIPKGVYRYIILLFLVTLFLRIVLTCYYYSNYGGIEQNVILGIQRILTGQALYQDPSAGNYAAIQYTPLDYYVTAAIAKGMGITALDVQSIYILCRVLAIIFNLLTVLTVALMIRSWNFSRFQSFVFAMPVIMVLTAHYYTRVDSLHLFLFSAALFSYLLYSKSGGLRHIVAAALFSGGCIMAKQSGILIAGTIWYCLFFIERKYAVAVFYCLCTFCFSWLTALACIRGDWHALYQNAYLGLKNGIDLSFLYNIFISQFFLDMVPCYVLGGIIAWLAVKKITDKTYRIIATGAVLSFLFAVVTGLKVASSNNYFTEFLVFVIIALPYLLQNESGAAIFFGRTITIRRFALIAFIILITSKTMGLFTALYVEKSIKNNKDEYAKEKMLYEYVTKELNIKKGEYIFFTGRLFLDNIFMEYTIMPTKDVAAEVYATDHSTYNYSAFIAGMNAGLIKYIITPENEKDLNKWNSSMPFILFDKDKFRLLGNYSGYSIYAYTSAPL